MCARLRYMHARGPGVGTRGLTVCARMYNVSHVGGGSLKIYGLWKSPLFMNHGEPMSFNVVVGDFRVGTCARSDAGWGCTGGCCDVM